MNLKSIFYFSLFSTACFNVNAQNPSDELLKINNVSYTVGEFERVYTKNLDLIKDDQQKKIDNYLDLFVLYKLKVAKAYELGLDKDSSYQNEYQMHRKQLAEQYLTNEETLNRLAKEAYDRSLYDIKASHIIFLANEFSSPQDTLKAYNKALEVRAEILNGKDFGEAAKQHSEDPTAASNSGDLGYFTVLKMVYPFETAAYNIPVGQVSEPIRSQFGYHLIKVFDKRKRNGKRDIAHIIINNNSDNDDTSKLEIDKVYNLLLKGEKFEDLARDYSDDVSSNQVGGKFEYYEPGVLNIEGIDEAALKLNTVGDFSKPFKSQYGWHIVKLLNQEPIPTYESVKNDLLRRVQSDNRSRIIQDLLIADLKKRYNYQENKVVYNKLVKNIEKDVLKEDWVIPTNIKANESLATFSDQQVLTSDFIKYFEENRYKVFGQSDAKNSIRIGYETFISETIHKFYENNLENEYPVFKYTALEFKEGLLLFDLMENEIWQKVKTDTLGYTNYYQSNLNNFKESAHIEGEVYEFSDKKIAEKTKKQLQRNFEIKEEELANMLPKDKFVIKASGKIQINNKALPKKYNLKKGVSDVISENNKYYIVVANSYKPEGVMSLDDARQNVIYEYQQVYENDWVNKLKENAKVEVNSAVLNELKSKYRQN